MSKKFVEEYKGVRILVNMITHTDNGTPHKKPLYHISSPDICIGVNSSIKKNAISEFKKTIDDILVNAKWKIQHGHLEHLLTTTEKFILSKNKD